MLSLFLYFYLPPSLYSICWGLSFQVVYYVSVTSIEGPAQSANGERYFYLCLFYAIIFAIWFKFQCSETQTEIRRDATKSAYSQFILVKYRVPAEPVFQIYINRALCPKVVNT